MSFTTPEFPGRTFSNIEEMNEAVEEKKRLQRSLSQDTIITLVEREEETPSQED